MTRKGIRPRKVPVTILTSLDQLKIEARTLGILNVEELTFKALSCQIALEKIRRGD
ncbi:hypothetical protein [Solibacillus isronensis]|uniref:hypothetical protein n=1 Tax=Solibacillus isronensis TaxID=412383 RepID=UPI0039A2F898